MPKSARTWTPVRETAEQWLERLGYCFHVPTCEDSAACRRKRELQQPVKPQVYQGRSATNRKLDLD